MPINLMKICEVPFMYTGKCLQQDGVTVPALKTLTVRNCPPKLA